MFRKLSIGALLMGAAMAPGQEVEGRGGWWDDLLEDPVLPLQRIVDDAATLRGQSVRFILQFRRLARIDNPYHTRFETDWYQNFEGWADEAPIWEKEVYTGPFRWLFARRGSESARIIAKAPEYARYVVSGKIVEVIRGEPWVEVLSLKRLPRELGEAPLVQIVKGFMLEKLKRWDAAASAFHVADDPRLPDAVRVLLHEREARSLDRGGKTLLGIGRLESALRISPGHPGVAALLADFRARVGGRKPGPKSQGGASRRQGIR